MTVLLAPDSFKDCLSTDGVLQAMKQGVKFFNPKAKCITLPASDGGEGFLKAVAVHLKGLEEIATNTLNPLGEPISGKFLWHKATNTAYIELAQASGIELLSVKERNPAITSTFGTGIQIQKAIEKGAQKIYLGIGGSATNDAGMGIAKALGFNFFDAQGNELAPIGENLAKVVRISRPESFQNIQFFAINDVLNPLFGMEGAAYTYARQKGANEQMIAELDRGLAYFSEVVKNELGCDYATLNGSGAAGGTAYGLKSFLNAKYISGTSFLLQLAQFDNLIKKHAVEVIITGEGKIDGQTRYGKFIHGLIVEATKYQIPVLAVCGKLDLDAEGLKSLGLSQAEELYDPSKSSSYSFENAPRLVSEKTFLVLKRHYETLLDY
ncbi:MAG TPA: glycerate kinase [Flavobacteriaceae bacterium]|nr:glycerate kinase [Flavobacteriaceae bacterium]HPF11968.1 glycerate kinase [Flavobacteriaceae bacterium]HQU22071.1 glycerate kinase [Flavobacteriaceae bacterium]HQU65400.1 glycerate kinase [Flavobacteriaceae bacterium]HRW45058.1 glycerate kinase [Flavobacteriaceae bacterium]